MIPRILTLLGVLALTATIAEARPKFSLQGLYGLTGTATAEVGTVDSEEDIESNIGIMGTIEFKLNRKSPFRLGARLGYQTTNIENDAKVETDFTAADAGVWARYILVPGRLVVYGAGSLAISALSIDPEGAGGDADGTGFNIMIGGGASYPVTKAMRVTAGLYFSRHQGTLEGDGNVEIDVALNQVQLAFGVAF
ncbi:MAG: hypothetical protein ACI9U2_000161 [Bradymonadia bacterium]|jgi:hypothetical protein